MSKANKYATAKAFRTALEARLNEASRREGIDLQLLRRHVAFDRLLARLFLSQKVPWVLKGGYAMELRFDAARATKDLDFTAAVGAGDRLIEMLQEAAAAELGDFFTYTIGKATQVLDGAPYGGARHPVNCVMDGRAFSNFHIDVGVGDVIIEPVESIQCRNWLEFARIVAPVVKAVSKEQQFAEKTARLHHSASNQQ